jgi:hypothetical protein
MTNPTSNRAGSGDGSNKKFQPERYLEQRNGLPYLPLKWRLAWLRTEQPQAIVTTRLVSHTNDTTIFKAQIRLPDGARATGWGVRQNPYADTPNSQTSLEYITEAENQALARALAVLGYGMEYVNDFDLPDEGASIPLRPNDEETNVNEVVIEVPMNGLSDEEDVVGDEEAEEVSGTINLPSVANRRPVIAPEPPKEPEKITRLAPPPVALRRPAPEPSYEEPEEEEVESERDEPIAPTPLRPVIAEEPARFSTEPTPFRSARPPVTDLNPPTPLTSRPAPVRRPGPTPVESANPMPPTPPATVGSSAVEDRLKGISDSKQILLIKQIFNEARRLHNLDEDRVDSRSVKRYGVPVNRLTIEQGEEFLEKIKAAGRPSRKE